MKTKNTLALSLILLSHLAVSQKITMPSFMPFYDSTNTGGFSGYASMYVTDSGLIANNRCIRSCFFIKFKLDTNGRVIEAAISKKAPLDVAEAYQKAVLASSGHWQPYRVDGKATISPSIILPVYVHLQLCPHESIKTDSIYDGFVNIFHHQEHDTDSLLKPCIVLKPAILVSYE
jgi:hypothetical protein